VSLPIGFRRLLIPHQVISSLAFRNYLIFFVLLIRKVLTIPSELDHGACRWAVLSLMTASTPSSRSRSPSLKSARAVIDLVADHKAIAILRHKKPDAVLISANDYVEFMNLRRERLNFLSERYDQMVARMQTPAAAAGVDALFNASPEELGRAAMAVATRG
jgi:antitoxin Phd